ncbi:hypothetical protein NEOLEDRAFT_1129153 [Neolentinus lepideus HHB14362 ss-1]|uniref:Transcription factor CBF/NF-Y/archaeal histone domain-containing protein n=1 Tax=Neolentinus lepideus HHB14362 ss-1 TaxID=1314782 RepID=A0A165UYJ2_9AGAM|nr:hypothetical protein NEOLEDRAFT_1129153 [Neolentinus lepideus HHB14362 ss-1]
MSSADIEDDETLQTQEAVTLDVQETQSQQGGMLPEGESAATTTQTPLNGTDQTALPKKREKKQPVPYSRAAGTSPLPMARVQRILKADEELIMVQREAVLAISIATEQFVKQLMEAVQRVAQRERRTTVQQRDMLSVVRRADEFVFLDEIMQTVVQGEPPAKRKPKALEKEAIRKPAVTTLLDQYVVNADQRSEDEDGGEDVIMNEDGTMALREI